MLRAMIGPLAAFLVVIGIGTALQGRFTERWGRNQTERLMAMSTNIMENVPLEFGDWVGVERETDKEQFQASNCEAAVSRTYRNSLTGEVVDVFLVSGTARNVTIHTPEWCYPGAGWDMQDEKVQYSIDCRDMDTKPEFLTASFIKEEPTDVMRLRIFWSFSEDGKWVGPRSEKAAFAGEPALAKVYLITQIPLQGDGLDENPAIRFADQFMATLNDSIFTPAVMGE